MLFTSIEFSIFLIIVLGVYWFFKKNLSAQNILLLTASYFFYGYWDVSFLFLIVISTAIDFFSAQMIDKGAVSKKNRTVISLFVVFSALFFVAIDYGSIDLLKQGLAFPFIAIHWDLLFANSFGWKVFLVSLLWVIAVNFIYPYFLTINEEKRKKLFMLVSISANMIILGFFKYFNFFADSFSTMAESLFGITPDFFMLDIVLPVGISFYTFQTMSYTIDVYRGELKSAKKFVDFAAYVSFFPQLVAGPIERGKHLLPQFQTLRPTPTQDEIKEGVWLIVWGLFKKMVIADNVASIVNLAFAPYANDVIQSATTPEDGLRLLVALYAFAIQIYCDFSGYTDIARGTAKFFGFDLMINFRLPYFATDPSSFWQRWHISLSSWLRDYLYIPLGGNRGGSLKTYRNLSLTMLLGGLWHGASWTFVLWGAYQGALLSIYRALGIDAERDHYGQWKKTLMMILFFHLTCVGWLIFRAQNIETIQIFLQSILFNPHGSPETWQALKTLLYYSWFLILFQCFQYKANHLNPMKNWHWFIRLTIWVYIIMSLLVLASSGSEEFIYFAF